MGAEITWMKINILALSLANTLLENVVYEFGNKDWLTLHLRIKSTTLSEIEQKTYRITGL